MKQNKEPQSNRKKQRSRISFNPLVWIGVVLTLLVVATQIENSSGKNPIGKLLTGNQNQTTISESAVIESESNDELNNTNIENTDNENNEAISESKDNESANTEIGESNDSNQSSESNDSSDISESSDSNQSNESSDSSEISDSSETTETTTSEPRKEKSKIVENKNKQQWLPNIKVEGIFNPIVHQLEGDYSLYYQALDAKISTKPLILNDQPMRSASVIKLFVLAAMFDQVAKGKLDLEENYSLKETDKVSGTGDIQSMATGTELTLLTLAEKMINISDNSATNILINLMGGIEAVQKIIVELGYPEVKLQRLMVDLEALEAGKDNYVAAKDVGTLLAEIYQGSLVSKEASEEMLDILKEQTDRRMLAQDLPTDVTYYGKTGNFEDYGVQNDAAIIETAKGAFVLVFLSQEGQKAEQLKAMNELGKNLTEQFIDFE